MTAGVLRGRTLIVRLQAGVPALITEEETLGIRLYSILRLKEGPSVGKYLVAEVNYCLGNANTEFSVNDDDLRVRTFTKRDGDNPEQLYQDFYNDFR
jgi:hypothetical protein